MTERAEDYLYYAELAQTTAGATGNKTQTMADADPWIANLVALKSLADAVDVDVDVTGQSATVSVGQVTTHSGLFSDDFNRADANLEASPAASGGGNWTHDGLIIGGISIVSNQLRCNTTGSTGSAYKTPNLGSLNQYVQFKAANISSATGPFVCCRLADADNFIGIRVGNAGANGQIEVYRRTTGTLSSRYASSGGAVALNDIVRLEVDGTGVSGDAFRVYVNGSLHTSGTIGGALTSSGTGLVARTIASNPWIDDFEAGFVGSTSVEAATNVATCSVGTVSVSTGGGVSVGVEGQTLTASVGSVSVTTDVSGTFSDNFNRANADLEDSPDASGGGQWEHDGLIVGGFAISSNQLVCNTTDSAGSAYFTPDLGAVDHFVEFSLPSPSILFGSFAAARLEDRNNFLGIRAGASTEINWGVVQVYARDDGVLTLKYQSTDAAVAANDVVKLGAVGTDFYVFRNGNRITGPTAIGALLSQTDTGLVARNQTGIMFDNFRAGPLTLAELTGNGMTAVAGDVSVVHEQVIDVTCDAMTAASGEVFVGVVVDVDVDVIGQALTLAVGSVTVNTELVVSSPAMTASGGTVVVRELGSIGITDSFGDSADSTEYTHLAVLGEPASDRIILIAVQHSNPVAGLEPFITLGGVEATVLAQTSTAVDQHPVTIASVPYPTSPTATLVITFSSAPPWIQVAVARLTGANGTPIDTAIDHDTSFPSGAAVTLDLPIDVDNAGMVFAFGGASVTGIPASDNFSGLDNGAPFTHLGGEANWGRGALLHPTADESARTVSFTIGGGDEVQTYSPAAAAVSFELGAAVVTVTGLDMTAFAGDAFVGGPVLVDGNELTALVGTVSVTSRNVINAGGQFVLASVGTATVSIRTDAFSSGQQLTVSVGSVSVVGKVNAPVLSNLLTASVGTVAVVTRMIVNATGTSLGLTASVGNEAVSLPKVTTVTGNGMTMTVGTGFAVRYPASVPVTGNQMVCSVGSVFITGSGLPSSGDQTREGMMLVMTRWMGN